MLDCYHISSCRLVLWCMWRLMTPDMGLRWHLMIPGLRKCSGFSVVFVSPLVGRRRLDPNESQPLSYKDGRPHFIMTTLRIICAPSTQLNGHNMWPLNSTMSAINSLLTFLLLSKIPSKCISRLHHWAPSTKSFLISTRTLSIPLLATCCSTL